MATTSVVIGPVRLTADCSTVPSAPGVLPPMYQSWTVPLTGSCHNTSMNPSPLKSPVPTTRHGLLVVKLAAPNSVVPCGPPKYQICAQPDLGSCQSKSGWPSLLKSATETTCHGFLVVISA